MKNLWKILVIYFHFPSFSKHQDHVIWTIFSFADRNKIWKQYFIGIVQHLIICKEFVNVWKNVYNVYNLCLLWSDLLSFLYTGLTKANLAFSEKSKYSKFLIFSVNLVCSRDNIEPLLKNFSSPSTAPYISKWSKQLLQVCTSFMINKESHWL